MKRALLVATCLGLAALVAPAAHADSTNVFHGDCFYDILGQPPSTQAEPEVYSGVIGDRSRTTTGDTPPMPIGATVTCWIEVNHVVAPGTTHSYGDVGGVPGVQVGADPVSFTAYYDDLVELCHTVLFADSTTQSECKGPIYIQLPPECPLFGCDFFGWMSRFFVKYVDPVVCPALAAAAGSYPGGVTVDPTGDVSVPDPLGLGLNPVYDCPPYVVLS